jgi:hypothetical protein
MTLPSAAESDGLLCYSRSQRRRRLAPFRVRLVAEAGAHLRGRRLVHAALAACPARESKERSWQRRHAQPCVPKVAEVGPVLRGKCPRPESNQCTRFRKPLLYPLSYGGGSTRFAGYIRVRPSGAALSTQRAAVATSVNRSDCCHVRWAAQPTRPKPSTPTLSIRGVSCCTSGLDCAMNWCFSDDPTIRLLVSVDLATDGSEFGGRGFKSGPASRPLDRSVHRSGEVQSG